MADADRGLSRFAGMDVVQSYADLDKGLSRILITRDEREIKRSMLKRRIEEVALATGIPVDQVLAGFETLVGQGSHLDSAMTISSRSP